MEVLPGIFYKTSYGCMCQSYCFFFWLFSCFFACWSKNTIKIGFFDDFEMLIFSFFGQKSRVNNLAMVGSITWPYFWPKICTERWPGYWPYFFHTFFVKTFFFQKYHSPCRKKRIFEKKKTTKNNKKQMARLLTYDGHIWQTVILLGWHPPSSSFSSTSGVRRAKSLVLMGRMQYPFLRRFLSKKPLVFSRGLKHRFQNDRFDNPEFPLYFLQCRIS